MGGGGVLPIMACMGRLRPKGVPFFMLQVYEKEWTSPTEVHERVWETVIWICGRAQRAEQMNFMAL